MNWSSMFFVVMKIYLSTYVGKYCFMHRIKALFLFQYYHK